MNNTIQQIFQKFGPSYKSKNSMSQEQVQVFNAILACKTKELGGHVYECSKCGETVYSYNSCKNRHCPNCQDFKKEQWIIKHEQDILSVPYFHIVFTVPGELHKIFYHNKRECYNIILKCAKEVVIELTEDEKYLGATPGIIEMLHTWTQVGAYHPHVHMIVTGGGITKDNKWIESKEDFFLPIKAIEVKFRGKLLSKLKKAKLKFYNEMEYLNNPKELNKYLEPLYEKTWICYCKAPFEKVENVYKYLARYVYKVCMSNERIEKIRNKTVVFRYKDSDDRSIVKEMEIKGEEYIRRFLLHVLPKNFMKIRYYGIYAGKNKNKRLKKIKKITKTKENKKEIISKLELLNKINGFDVSRCKKCKGELLLIRIIEKKKPPDRKGYANEYVKA